MKRIGEFRFVHFGPSLAAVFLRVAFLRAAILGSTILASAGPVWGGSPNSGDQVDLANGRKLFERVWSVGDDPRRDDDGLGPLFNARGCQNCHLKDGRGHPPETPEENAVSMFLRLSVPPRR